MIDPPAKRQKIDDDLPEQPALLKEKQNSEDGESVAIESDVDIEPDSGPGTFAAQILVFSF